ncbi:class I SAM-dependent methyltransferase [Leptolyngbyaceae cyanobacterium CCMR0082]|uniref:Class I SAM-dependent methyltransferase n=1 Tax=Adonisia turfae CCMR0082 TaxID=2304604 RepID=A0A6M0SG21_9CYAN|nr:class I SAM-dependent methyltransferase [Adonisia turfae]NEZ66552.1 class I SAM-dependent methyltransferase [Adonisia turfae CCMR0082]
MHKNLFDKRLSCPTCGSEKNESIYSASFSEKDLKDYLVKAYGQPNQQLIAKIEYSLLKCQDCELIFQEYVPTSELMSQIYGTWTNTEEKFQNYGISYYSIYSQDILQILAYLDKVPTSVKVLDFGMGWGRWALMAKAFGCDVYGVEISSQCIQYAERNGIKVISWEDISSYKFDLIHTDQVFEHLAEPLKVLNYLKQSLKPDGVIKICVPNSFGIRYRLNRMDWSAPKGSLKSLNPVAPLEHINCFYRKSMLELTRKVNLLEVKIPMRIQYQYTNVWDTPKRALRNLIMPIYRNILGLQNYYIFKHSKL